ncbi:G2-specific serine/threonine protein kinase [Yamadazyma tenuis]|uniref:non-specific serine/threonine protein kinase n=1 Tax=Candida tenuis (strain ATCC 10573 / BCRC 21748 / CBS 615 / JCM 9827 / NBRC 10315 / NRRL Y-1498 / VKM Y-70) TaxID=590646 RepID=G3B6K0_CANTC|nr:kinase-like protein [Yamadazyma tenuis ATCC 10573]EGV63488.1 kinase-like protein [Yamadazyma tenuis ATCC 10573]WEJ96688.1 G2-specific serine/threonine protein kinase [Yamadazyma tenuis]
MTSSISDEYEALEVIGKGSFGTVRKVRQKSDNHMFVRKEIDYTSMNTQERNQLISELRILRELNHPHVVKYCRHDHLMSKKSIHIYMEYCDGGDLGQVVANFKKNKETVPEEFVWQVMVQTLLALHKCHYGIDAKKVNLFASSEVEPPINSETVIIHRDIKPDNIFLLNAGKTIKLGDFGLAKMLTSQNDFAKTYVGTPYYMSPEVLMDNPYSPVCDIWSLGCVLFELCALQPPFQAKTHLSLQTKIKKGIIPDLPSCYSLQLTSMIKECITVDPESRPSCFDLLQALPVRFLRKEMELKGASAELNEYQKQLVSKNDELKKKEAYLNTIEQKIYNSKVDLQEEYTNIQKKCDMQKKQIENELIEEFEARKKLMDQEAKEVRLNYQREFKLVVEQEVQQRLKEILMTQNSDLIRKKSDPTRQNQDVSTPQAKNFLYQNNHHYSSDKLVSPNKPRGPKELMDESPTRRTPLKIRNDYDDYDSYKNHKNPQSPTRLQGNNYRKRITDELEPLTIDKRNIPEYEELYLRNKNYRH